MWAGGGLDALGAVGAEAGRVGLEEERVVQGGVGGGVFEVEVDELGEAAGGGVSVGVGGKGFSLIVMGLGNEKGGEAGRGVCCGG